MPKLASPTSPTNLTLDAHSPVPLYKQLYDRLRSAILTGQLERGTRIPSTRNLAAELGISRSTTALAYEQLILEGYLDSQVGHGTSVALRLPELLVSQPSNPVIHKSNTAVKPSIQLASRVYDLQNINHPEHSGAALNLPFRGGEPALDLFPYALWARLVSRNARHLLSRFARYQPSQGYYPLREAIAAHIGITRGVRCTPNRIIITSGSQGALDLAARTLLTPGDAAWVENPGYFGAQGALRAAGAQVIPVPVDEHGINIELGQQIAPNARLVSTTPSHQFPTGVTMTLARRLALLDWAKQADAWIIEDDYDSEYRFNGRPL
ncbi:MAG: PLP-dependent aminotransferase family protein, partial [Chloroflexia bacterium]